ncbi:autotransporter outer membrane beta-barrel domain-containing protein, partial [Flavobacterium branchiicola]
MRNKLLPLFIILGTYSMHSQVGIGTKDPHKSSQLEVSASDKGVLIPNVALTSLTDAVTIKEAKESLLVFNITNNTLIVPGYYYWYDNRWNRLALSTEVSGSGTVIYNPTTQELTYIDSSGNTQIININDLETITTLTDNNDGTYTYVNEKKVAVTINVVGDVTSNFSTIANNTEVKQIIENIVNNTTGNVSYDNSKKEFTYLDQSGATQVININDMVKNNETVTTLSNNNDGTYTYSNEAGDKVTINVIGDVTSNFSTIANNTTVKEIIENIVNNTAGNVSYDSTKNEFTYLDQSGATKVININDMVKNNETVTTLSNNNDGTYTYSNEAGDKVTINVIGDVTSNFSTIANTTEVKQIIENIVNNTAGNVSYDSTKNEFTYLDQSGATKVININDMVKNNETVTTLSNNNDGTYTYSNEAGDKVTINVIGDVTSNFSTIANNTEVKQIIENIVNNTAGNVSYDSTKNEFTYLDQSGATKVININDMVKNNETVTTLSNNNDGSYTYTNEAGTEVKINVVGDVTSNFSTIANNTTVKEIIENIVNNTAGNVSYDSTKNEFTYLDQSGATKVININDMVKNNETVTTLSNNNDG